MPRWLKIVLGIVGGVGVFVAAIIIIVFWATSGAVETIDRQLAALNQGDMAAAYEETSEAFRDATSLEDFTAFVDAHPILKDVASHSFTSRSLNNSVGIVSGTVTSSTGGVLPVTFKLVKEKDSWKILGIDLSVE